MKGAERTISRMILTSRHKPMLYQEGVVATCCITGVSWNFLQHCVIATPHSGKLLLRTVANGPCQQVSILMEYRANQSILHDFQKAKIHGNCSCFVHKEMSRLRSTKI